MRSAGHDYWGEGYKEGHKIGAGMTLQGYATPRQFAALARRVAETDKVHAIGKTEWQKGFHQGYA